ncbi:IS630 family transposase [aff. Roholtiella sp. LEGE 12411]|uniref:IS630 family transposase n=2 Tax=Nostocales TaxID=1161 RepID=UPI00187FC531|nr:IS630 family transposase [aff. Roholtiella sp. LEGE 12411]
MGTSLQYFRYRSTAVSTYRWSSPPFSKQIEKAVDREIRKTLELAATAPQQKKLNQEFLPRWTLKRLVAWIDNQFNLKCCRESVRKTLKNLGFSWKKARKLLNKANSKKRAEYLENLQGLLDDALNNGHLLVFIDEAHIHLDSDEGYGWSIKGERFWVSSNSPGRSKVSFYGIYVYNYAKVKIFPYLKADQFNTIDVLKHLRTEFPERDMTLIWDGAPYHRSQTVKEALEILQINLEPLPGYSPDFMPVEHLWQWLREDVTYHTCYQSPAELIERVHFFEQDINSRPFEICDRLWVKNHLEEDEEKLRVSR